MTLSKRGGDSGVAMSSRWDLVNLGQLLSRTLAPFLFLLSGKKLVFQYRAYRVLYKNNQGHPISWPEYAQGIDKSMSLLVVIFCLFHRPISTGAEDGINNQLVVNTSSMASCQL